MSRRIQTATAVLCGGGPADGERVAVEDGAAAVVVREATGPGPVSLADAVRAHAYERREDGRYVYAGAVLRLPEVPDTLEADEPAVAPAATDEEHGASAVVIAVLIVVVAVALACLGALT